LATTAHFWLRNQTPMSTLCQKLICKWMDVAWRHKKVTPSGSIAQPVKSHPLCEHRREATRSAFIARAIAELDQGQESGRTGSD
jgi:hypothetical protein